MLVKLIKYEWKRMWKIPTLLLLILWGGALISSLPFAGLRFQADGIEPVVNPGVIYILGGIIWGLFLIAAIGVSFGINIYVALQFYFSMYSDEGYLTHTLPVTPRQLLIAKGLVMILWNMLNALGVFFSLLIFGGMGVLLSDLKWALIWQVITEGVRVIVGEFGKVLEIAGGSWGEILAIMLVGTVANLLMGTMHVIGAITLGQLARKHKIGAAIGAGCIIAAVLSLVEGVLQIPLTIGIYMEENLYSLTILTVWISILIYGALSAGLFVISERIIRKRLNLE